ncbi:hypothetical protein ACGRHY_29180 [Streptomyces sp. HK10]|uniref:hypothetical protein n=1 Tax=Streptomyces sp. HK10 TaxID=3373255 RepID=UPI0037484687
MQRSLTRRLLSAYDRTPVSENPNAHLVKITLSWLTDPALSWTPGPGFVQYGRFWMRERHDGSPIDNGDGTYTGVIAGFRPGHAESAVPAWDGRPWPWADDEVWTITTPRREDLDNELNAKAYRAIPLAFADDVTLVRESYTGHPAAAADAYQKAFRMRYGLTPTPRHTTEGGGYTLTVCYRPNLPWRTDPAELAHACTQIARELGATVHIRRDSAVTRSPFGSPFPSAEALHRAWRRSTAR